jgi:hypothetical protein
MSSISSRFSSGKKLYRNESGHDDTLSIQPSVGAALMIERCLPSMGNAETSTMMRQRANIVPASLLRLASLNDSVVGLSVFATQ